MDSNIIDEYYNILPVYENYRSPIICEVIVLISGNMLRHCSNLDNKHKHKNCEWLKKNISNINNGGAWLWIQKNLTFKIVPKKLKDVEIKTIEIDTMNKFDSINRNFGKEIIDRCVLTDNIKKSVSKKYKLYKGEYYQ